jgi:hypothetical protein
VIAKTPAHLVEDSGNAASKPILYDDVCDKVIQEDDSKLAMHTAGRKCAQSVAATLQVIPGFEG